MHTGSIWRAIGHRGAPRDRPPNTILSFLRAIELGCGSVECDVRLSLDRVLVLCHDPEARDRNGRVWPVAHHTAAELAKLDLGCGEGVPTLEQLVSEMAGRGGVMADMKVFGDGVERRTADALRPLGLDGALISGISTDVADRFRNVWPKLRLSATFDADAELPAGRVEFEAWVRRLKTEGVSWEYSLATPERIEALHAAERSVYCWTVDDAGTIRDLYAAGVDGIISNRPDLLAPLAAPAV